MEPRLPHLRGQTPASLAGLFPDLSLPDGVARRVLSRVVFDDRDDLADVRGLSARAARGLRERASLERLQVVDRRRSHLDPFVKYLFRTFDGRVFESVRIPLERPRWSVCVSSQVGCALECAFCETGRLGFTRNLEAWEIVEQVLTVRREGPERPVTGVVFQGQGEPFQNYAAVIRAAEILRDPCGARIRGDRITISTVGVLPMIERYTEEGHPYRLILSLSSAFSEKRAALMPVGRRYDVPALAAAMRRHTARHGGPVNLAWVLMSGVNTGPEEARELGRLFRGVKVRLSCIDVNDAYGAPEVNSGAPTYRDRGAIARAGTSGRFTRASDEERGRFLNALSEEGIGFVRRYSGGPDIHAACGMLAAQSQGGQPITS